MAAPMGSVGFGKVFSSNVKLFSSTCRIRKMFRVRNSLKSLHTAAFKGFGSDARKYSPVLFNDRSLFNTLAIHTKFCHTHATQDDVTDKETAGNRKLELHEATELIEEMRESGKQVPYRISEPDLEYFASLQSKKQRKRFIAFLYHKESLKLKDRQKRLERQEQRGTESKPGIPDGPMENRIMLKLNPKSILEFDNWNLSRGMKFGQNLVFDFSYEQYMRRPDAISLSMQMSYVIHENKQAKEPFHIHFVNHLEGSLSHKEMVRTNREDVYSKMMVTMSSQSLLDSFQQDELVYLSPDSPNIMHNYDYTKTYVIGALVDGHRIEKGASLGIAKRLGIAHARLPIDFYLKWGGGGGKDLTLDQVVKMLLSMKDTNDWMEAMKYVPTRKHLGIKTPEKFINKKHEMRELSSKDQFVFSRAKPRNINDNVNNDRFTFQGAFDNKRQPFKPKFRNKSAQKNRQGNFWEE